MMKLRTDNAVRDALADMLGILEYKVRSGAMSKDDTRALLDILESGGGIRATVSDLAGYYRQSEDNVRHILHRHLMPPPVRRVYYDFGAFRDAVPEKWRNRVSKSTD